MQPSLKITLRKRVCLLVAGVCLLLAVSVVSAAFAQEPSEILREEAELIDQEPFDLITLTDAAGGQSVKVLPIPFPNRAVPSNPPDTQRLRVVLVDYQDREYEVLWRDIQRVELYEQRIYDEAVARMEAKDFIGAFQNLSFLLRNYPEMGQVENLRREFLMRSAAERFSDGELAQTLSALEELRSTAPGYRQQTVDGGLSRAADLLIQRYEQQGDLASAKVILNRLSDQYGPTLPVVERWQDRLEELARQKMDEALALMEAKEYRLARQSAVDMLRILPDYEAGQDLIQQINKVHPMVRVGVMQRSGDLDPASLINWPARRAGGLVQQALIQFLRTGAEGGRYGFALGTFRQTDDRQQLVLSLDPQASPMTAFELAQALVQRAEVGHEDYDPSWAAIFQSISATSARQVTIQLKRPNVLPHALMQWVPLEPNSEQPLLLGEYHVASQDDRETAFQLRASATRPGQPVELVEVFYDSAQDAINDLLRGEIDVLDQLFPADAKRLAADRRVTVGAYALPTTHMLIPISEDPYLANGKFRRALLYATNRQEILAGELLGSTNTDDGRLVSGPFPMGDGQSDLLAYAYNESIQPIAYNPRLAKLLTVMADDEVKKSFQRNRRPLPKRAALTIGCPDFEFARVAVQAMIQQWLNVGIEAKMVILPSGQTTHPDIQCDLIYVVTTMWEPATDIERLLGGDGLATSSNPFVVRALEDLRNARNWRNVRDALQTLHELVDYHLPILPLWQVTDRFAYTRYVSGLEDGPVSLYQDIAQWRVNLGQVVQTTK